MFPTKRDVCCDKLWGSGRNFEEVIVGLWGGLLVHSWLQVLAPGRFFDAFSGVFGLKSAIERSPWGAGGSYEELLGCRRDLWGGHTRPLGDLLLHSWLQVPAPS